MEETKRKVGRPEGKKRGAITLSLPLDLVEWLRKTQCPSQIVEDLVRPLWAKTVD